MKRAFAVSSVAVLLSGGVSGQSTSPQPAFEVADIHSSPRGANPNMRSVFRGGRYELRNANMVDLIRTAYGVDAVCESVLAAAIQIRSSGISIAGSYE